MSCASGLSYAAAPGSPACPQPEILPMGAVYSPKQAHQRPPTGHTKPGEPGAVARGATVTGHPKPGQPGTHAPWPRPSLFVGHVTDPLPQAGDPRELPYKTSPQGTPPEAEA